MTNQLCNQYPTQAPLTEAQLNEFFQEQCNDDDAIEPTNSEYKFMGVHQPWEPAPLVPLMVEGDEIHF